MKLWHFSAKPPPPITICPDWGARLCYRWRPAGVLFGDLGVSLLPSALLALKERGTMIWHASHTLRNTYSTHEGNTKTEKRGHTHTLVALIQISWLHAEWTLEDKMIILKRKYCLTVCSFSPFMPSLDASFARVYNATCLWLLMTTAALHSTILLTHLSTLMNHLYSGFLFARVDIHARVGVCGSEVPKQPQGCPFLCIWANYLYLRSKRLLWNARGGGIAMSLAAVRCTGAFCLCERPEVGDDLGQSWYFVDLDCSHWPFFF